jgi:hypothetical protein
VYSPALPNCSPNSIQILSESPLLSQKKIPGPISPALPLCPSSSNCVKLLNVFALSLPDSHYLINHTWSGSWHQHSPEISSSSQGHGHLSCCQVYWIWEVALRSDALGYEFWLLHWLAVRLSTIIWV